MIFPPYLSLSFYQKCFILIALHCVLTLECFALRTSRKCNNMHKLIFFIYARWFLCYHSTAAGALGVLRVLLQDTVTWAPIALRGVPETIAASLELIAPSATTATSLLIVSPRFFVPVGTLAPRGASAVVTMQGWFNCT